jgi:c-di-GMP-binding flagellar brake protein YcgR
MKVEKVRFIPSFVVKGSEMNVTIKTKKFIGRYKAKVENLDDNYIYIEAPYIRGEPALIPHGSEVEATFFNKHGKFIIKTTVFNKNNEISKSLLLNLPKDMYLVQQRNFFRIELRDRIDLKILTVTKKESEIELHVQKLSGTILDLSAGGAKIELGTSLNNNQILEVDIKHIIPDISPMISKIVKIYDDKNTAKTYGLLFLSIREGDRDRIVKFGLDVQSKTGKLA